MLLFPSSSSVFCTCLNVCVFVHPTITEKMSTRVDRDWKRWSEKERNKVKESKNRSVLVVISHLIKSDSYTLDELLMLCSIFVDWIVITKTNGKLIVNIDSQDHLSFVCVCVCFFCCCGFGVVLLLFSIKMIKFLLLVLSRC